MNIEHIKFNGQDRFQTYDELFHNRIKGILNYDLVSYTKGYLSCKFNTSKSKKTYIRLANKKKEYIMCYDIVNSAFSFKPHIDIYMRAKQFIKDNNDLASDKGIQSIIGAKPKQKMELANDDIKLVSVLITSYPRELLGWIKTRAESNNGYRMLTNRNGDRILVSFETYNNAKSFVKSCVETYDLIKCEHSPFQWIKRKEIANDECYETIY